MKVQSIGVLSIKTAKYNPKNRTQNIKSLIDSIKEYGILVPLIVDNERNLIDGHRRLASAKKLKLGKVPAITVASTLPKDKAFEVINTTSKKISNNDMLYIYVNGGSVPKKVLRAVKEIEALIGPSGLKNLSDKNVTYTVLNYARKVQVYCKETNPEFLKKTLFWLVNHKMTYYVRRAMEAHVKRDILIAAIKNNKPLKVSYQ